MTDDSQFHLAQTFLITFTTYGTRLHGDARGTVDASHNHHDEALLDHDPDRAWAERERMRFEPFILSNPARERVFEAVAEVCTYRKWALHALNVRTNHLHAVVSANAMPEKVMNDFKAYATRGLVSAGMVEQGRKVWTRGGSLRGLFSANAMLGACEYVLQGQDGPRFAMRREVPAR